MTSEERLEASQRLQEDIGRRLRSRELGSAITALYPPHNYGPLRLSLIESARS